jgi:phosphoenolpyruvate-protein kinase (PTS system EI component)
MEHLVNIFVDIQNDMVEENIPNIKNAIKYSKKEIISIELKNIFDFKNSLENIILTRNQLLEDKKIDDKILQKIFKDSSLI